MIEKVNFDESNFELLKKDLGSVSLTCKNNPTKNIQNEVLEKIKAAGVSYGQLIITKKNINFILPQNQKDLAIKTLHSLIH